jgi:hypothetical protein
MPDAPPQPSEPPFENRSLFSDHFLGERLPSLPGWGGDDVAPAWAAVRERWARVRGRLAGMREAQTEEEWIRPVLAALGWSFDVQPPVRGLSGAPNTPDYALFLDEGRREAAAALRGDEPRYWGAAAVVADAKYWGRPLDVARGDARDLSNANPSFQVVAYLFVTGVSWAVLTNGAEWRLYSARARSRVDTYFAVDLARVLEADDAEGFRWFARFFGAAAFRPEPATGRAFVDRVLDGSADYGRGLETRLKRLIFERVFGELAEGFVEDRRRRGLPVDDAALAEVYQGTLRLLYRILFLLHAEARDLLPVRERGYGAYSFMRIRRRVVDKVVGGDPLSSVSTDLWGDLRSLFRIVDEGDPGLKVPRYDGGLFRASHPLNRFLAEHEVADRFLYPALDRLSRDEDGHWIDYKALDVEQLGSLYEGLLEFRLRLGDDGRPVLENDAGERHATGSYYTPHWVVEYIVAVTVRPVLEAREAEFREALALCSGPGAPGDAALRLRRAADRLLSIRVCDPAMGSGHFLVHAANWLSERLIAFLSEFPDNPVLEELARIRAEILERLALDGIVVDALALRDTALLKRLVIKRCIYGVDLNPMATELAKLSLWLDSFTVGAPLSFLDHHLKHGNSLVGTRVLEVSRAMESTAAGQFDSFGGPFAHVLRAAELMLDVVAQTDATAERVAESVRIFADFEATMAPYKRLLDLWVSRHFGNARASELVSGEFAPMVLDSVRGRDVRFNRVQRAALEKAGALAEELRFFHWDLEFPEVFVDLGRAAWREDGGFDAVIGNPPYVRQEQVKALKPYFSSAYADVHDGSADLYVYFYREGVELLRPGGRLSFIVTNKWLRAGYGSGLRRFFAERTRVERIVDFGHAPIFPDADVFPCIVVVERPGEEGAGDARNTMVTAVPREALGGAIGEYIEANAYAVPSARFGAEAWSLEPAEVQALMDKIRAAGVPLEEFAARSFRGALTGDNTIFLLDQQKRKQLVDEDPTSEELLHPVLRGQDTGRWHSDWDGQWLIFSRRGIEIDRYPAVKRYLSANRRALEPKPKNWSGPGWAGRKSGSYKWYELQDAAEFFPLFSQPKIVYPDIMWESEFSLDLNGYYCVNSAYFIPSDSRWLLAVLNSPLMWYYAWKTAVHGKDEALRFFGDFVHKLPIASPVDGVSVDTDVDRLTELTRERSEAHAEMMDWLRTEHEIEKPGQKLEAFDELSSDDFVAAVRDRRPKKAPSLGPRQVAELRKHHADYGPRLQKIRAIAGGLERRLSNLVNQAYGLTEAEVELMWRTAPPRMPVGR